MIFTPNQLEELFNIIEYHHTLFIIKHIGKQVLTLSDQKILKSFGIDLNKFPLESGSLSNAFKFGVLASYLGDETTSKMSYSDFTKYVQRGQFIPLIKREQEALEFVKRQSYTDIKGLGNKIVRDLDRFHNEVSQRTQYEKIIQTAAEKAIAERGGVKEMISYLGNTTGDWARDLGRISEYIMHNAYEEGRSAEIESEHGREALVYKDVYLGACRYCIKAYLTNGIGSQPIIFKLSELRANGTNIGRKAADWLAVIAAMHPWCRCTQNHLREGEVWNEEKKMFVMDYSKVELKVQRKSKIKVYINNILTEA